MAPSGEWTGSRLRCGSDGNGVWAHSSASLSSNSASARRRKQACNSVRNAPSRARGEGGIGMAAQPDPPDGYGQPDQRKQPYEVTKGNGSSWIFEPRLTWANVLRRVQQPAFSLVNHKLRPRRSLGGRRAHQG